MRYVRNLALVSVLFVLGCADKNGEENIASNAATNSQSNGEFQCIVCGEATRCGESCNDPCGCCCDAGEERVANGGLDRCTPDSCWERVGEEPADMGTTTDMTAAADASVDGGGEDMAVDMRPEVGDSTCLKTPNGAEAPVDTCLHGSAEWLAWEWVPDEDMTISEIRMHTDDGNAALLADAASRPGIVLAEGVLSAADADGWRTLTVVPPVTVTAGSTYWLGEDVLVCSVAADGTAFTYFSSDSSAGPWSGPFMSHTFTAQLEGTCP